ncbi:MAG: hypothetical protein HKP61_02575 [Dactylosporangium sp.]|nr:hypothetical protein [Dactylosporangium sp.]
MAESAAQATAVVALLLAAGSAAHAAGICTFWALVLGLSALRPRLTSVSRRVRVGAALGCMLLGYWLLLVNGGVAVTEAYTVPAALVVVGCGWLARRRGLVVSSWIGYGPALLVGLLPTLLRVLGDGDAAPLRRLALGTAGVVLVLIGAAVRQQAQVVTGAVTTVVVALHETLLLLDRIPRWIPLAVAGVLLVGIATTYERRRRDLARLRDAVVSLR